MPAVWARNTAELGVRWRSWDGLELLVGLMRGAVLTAAAASRRTQTALPRFLAGGAPDALISPQANGLEGFDAEVARLPAVAAAGEMAGVPLARVDSGQVDALPSAPPASVDGRAVYTIYRPSSVSVPAGRAASRATAARPVAARVTSPAGAGWPPRWPRAGSFPPPPPACAWLSNRSPDPVRCPCAAPWQAGRWPSPPWWRRPRSWPTSATWSPRQSCTAPPGTATIGHALVTSVRRRRRDLAILKTLGFLRHQVSATVAWQSTALAGVALVAGIPLGLALGHRGLALFTRQLGAASQARLPWPALVVIVPAAVVVANLAAALPARAAARTRPSAVLRAE